MSSTKNNPDYDAGFRDCLQTVAVAIVLLVLGIAIGRFSMMH